MSAMLVYQKGSYHPKTTSFGDDRGHPSCRSCWEPHLFSRRKRADGTFWHSTELHLRGQQWTRFLQEDCHRIDLYGNIYGKVWKYIWNFCDIFLHVTEFRVSIHDIHVLDLSCTFPQFSFVLRLCGLRKPMSFISLSSTGSGLQSGAFKLCFILFQGCLAIRRSPGILLLSVVRVTQNFRD
jgi:hypothetical protein